METDIDTENIVWAERPEPVKAPLPSTAERFLVVLTDISGVLNAFPTEV
jgi:hypothetical protein